MAEDVFARLATTQLIHDAKAALTYHLFGNELAASAWLLQH